MLIVSPMNVLFWRVCFVGLVSAPQIECPVDDLVRPAPVESDVIIQGTLSEVSPDDSKQLPTFNASDVSQLLVKVEVDRLIKGSFPVDAGSAFLLAVHSVTLRFGYDHVGEAFLFAFKALSDNDFELIHQSRPKESLFAVMIEVLDAVSETEAGDAVVNVMSSPDTVLRVVTTSDRLPPELRTARPVLLGLRLGERRWDPGARACLVLIRRSQAEVSSLRLLRVYHGAKPM